MKQRKSPQQKKILSYKRDRRIAAEYPQAFRRYWPLKKARASRKYRRQVTQALNEVKEQVKPGDGEYFHIQSTPVRRDKVQKWEPNRPLREWVDSRLKQRVEFTARNFFKQPYDRALHRDRFVRFLSTLTQGHSISSRKLALRFGALLQPPEAADSIAQRSLGSREKQDQLWLQAFFQDEPEWERKLWDWVKSFPQQEGFS